MAQVARISGPLLAANLVRTQANLAFDNDLLYVGHLTGKIGVRTASPNAELNIVGQHSANNYYADRLTSGNLKVDTTGITAITGDIILDSQDGIIHADELHTQKLTFNDNYIGSLANSNIVFDPNGAGVVNFPNTKIHGNVDATGNITIPGNLSVGGTINLGDQPTDTIDFDFLDFTQDLVPNTTAGLHNLGSTTNIWNNINTAKAVIGDIEIDNDYITTSTLNNNLIIRANGTGSIIIDDITLNGHNVISVGDLQITPGGGSISLNSTRALKVPDGTEAQRTNLNRDLRYNTTTNFFELFSTAYTPLRGIWSEDRQTYVLANATNDFSFVTNGVTNTTLSSTSLTTNRLVSQNNVAIDGNTISTATTNAAMTLTATGTVNIANLEFDTNTIHNTIDQAFKFSKTGAQGYIHFDTTYGVVFPAGSTAQRPAGVIGQTRFNTGLAYLETYDGTQWANIAGAGGGITEEYMEELVNIYTIALA
jgi:hypothetical protein